MEITPLNSFHPLVKMQVKSDSPEALKDAAEGFETLLTHQLVQEMQKGLDGESMFGKGVEGHTLGAMAEWELAQHLAKTLDLGILQQLQSSLTVKKGEQ